MNAPPPPPPAIVAADPGYRPATLQLPVAAPQTPNTEQLAKFRVTVTADQTVIARVLAYMDLVARRNAARARLGVSSVPPEVELVRLINKHPKMPAYSRDLGTVYLRINEDRTKVAVEYCLRDCDSVTAPLVRYSASVDQFMRVLDKEAAGLAKKYGRNDQ